MTTNFYAARPHVRSVGSPRSFVPARSKSTHPRTFCPTNIKTKSRRPNPQPTQPRPFEPPCRYLSTCFRIEKNPTTHDARPHLPSVRSVIQRPLPHFKSI